MHSDMVVSRVSRDTFYRTFPPLPPPLGGPGRDRVDCDRHFHSDHYGGMTANWSHGPIYCSSITANLVLQQIKVSPEYVVKLPMYQPDNIEGVDITLIDANQFLLFE
jgi:hypothetical protein